VVAHGMPLLELRGISKSFGGVAALTDVDFTLRAGEIHGLVGENGAGKSTTMKIIAGVHTEYQGTMHLAGQRMAIVRATPELQERELIKLATLAAALAGALRRRGVADPAATLAAEAGVAVFKVAFQRWVSGTEELSLGQIIREAMAAMKTVTAGSA